ncbi:hypothetical protein KFK09_021024 [Dendrobium nobile]|uniref:Retrotransposon Copia-like N-terminal domain-containing protein n=1 Tax=Dendrobium nobile TaxID=94219 RepID=A0A8T3AN14_DENNO|nr:hypothetical protein KFK09_021024 [Dendrobium nobile]
MASQESSSTSSIPSISQPNADISIPASLKFLMSNVKTILNTSLTTDNYPIWRSQITKLFSANNFFGYLDGFIPKPPKQSLNADNAVISNPQYSFWQLIDQNLDSALFSTISASILPYVLNLDSCMDIWFTLERRLQSANRSRIMQLKNELHQLHMKDRSMVQYLSEIKQRVDVISAAGSTIEPEDIILYTLNGLPSSYNAFKTSIRTKLHLISLDDLYALLCSEETNLAVDARPDNADQLNTHTSFALTASRGRGRG